MNDQSHFDGASIISVTPSTARVPPKTDCAVCRRDDVHQAASLPLAAAHSVERSAMPAALSSSMNS